MSQQEDDHSSSATESELNVAGQQEAVSLEGKDKKEAIKKEESKEEQEKFMAEWVTSFRMRVHTYLFELGGSGASRVIANALKGSLNIPHLKSLISRVAEREKDCDMTIITLMRLLYMFEAVASAHEAAADKEFDRDGLRAEILSVLTNFPYWPDKVDNINNNGKQKEEKDGFQHLCFWSENHIFMTLGSAHLAYRYSRSVTQEKGMDECTNPTLKSAEDIVSNTQDESLNHEEQMLLAYLKGHVSFGGMYEVLSHVYIPYSVSALLNLVDFSPIASIKEAATNVVNNIVRILLLGCSDEGIVTLTASARAFTRTRHRTNEHNANQLVYLLTGQGGWTGSSQCTDFIATTTWTPSYEVLAAFYKMGYTKLNCNHSVDEIRNIYSDIPERERTPFYWSAGLLVHPAFAVETKAYQRRHLLQQNDTLKPLKYLPDVMISTLLSQYAFLSEGQCYCGITLNHYKRPGGLCLSSFENFNVGNASFQQLPWCANIAGAGVWTQTGGDSRDMFSGYGMTNTFNPSIIQEGALCVISHTSPSIFTTGLVASAMLAYKANLYWPYHLLSDPGKLYALRNDVRNPNGKGTTFWLEFDDCLQESPVPCWRIAKKDRCYIGVYCTHATYLVTGGRSNGAQSKPYSTTIACNKSCHAFVVLVGTEMDYYSEDMPDETSDKDEGIAFTPFDNFVEHCLSISVKKSENATGTGWVICDKKANRNMFL